MDREKKKQGKKCFIVTPIGNEDSDIFRRAKGVIDSVIKPVLEEYGFDDIKPAYEINVSGMINTQIINRIVEDDLVIVNLTGNNPNVMYELCLRHVVAKPIIHICENGTMLPFDIKDNRTIFYKNDMLGVEELKEKMKKFITEISYKKEYMDNPIYSACNYGKLLKETKGSETNTILKLLVYIAERVSEIRAETKSELIYLEENPVVALFEYDSDIKRFDEQNARLFLARNSKTNMPVYELAHELGITSGTVKTVTHMLGIEVANLVSSIEEDDFAKIVEYLCEQKSSYP